eukprot:scaffold51741_cov38-Attheya_sp.AAC.2
MSSKLPGNTRDPVMRLLCDVPRSTYPAAPDPLIYDPSLTALAVPSRIDCATFFPLSCIPTLRVAHRRLRRPPASNSAKVRRGMADGVFTGICGGDVATCIPVHTIIALFLVE